MSNPTATARKITADQLATIGVEVPARLLVVKAGRVVKVCGISPDRAEEVAALLGSDNISTGGGDTRIIRL